MRTALPIDDPRAQHDLSNRRVRRWVIAVVGATVVGGLAIVSPSLARQLNAETPPPPVEEERYPVSTGDVPPAPIEERYPVSTVSARAALPTVSERPEADGGQQSDATKAATADEATVAGPVEQAQGVDGQGVRDGRVDEGGIDGSDQPGGRSDD